MIRCEKIGSGRSIADREQFLSVVTQNLPDKRVLLSTCDRVELYADDLTDRGSIEEAAHHLFRVTSGLDSPLIGESQILHQVKLAYKKACGEKTASKGLHLLFQSALRVGKMVRSTTGISSGALSHGQAAVEAVRQKFGRLEGKRIVVIGVNNLNTTVLRYLVKHGADTVFLASRHFEKAQSLAGELGCSAFRLEERRSILSSADVLITATSAPHYIITPEDCAGCGNLLAVDLAVPRDIDPAVGDLHGITVLTVADVEHCVSLTAADRKDAAAAGEIIATAEAARFAEEYVLRMNDVWKKAV